MSEQPHQAEGSADPWLTVEQVSTELSIHPSTVRLWLGQGRLASTRIGGRKWRIRRSALDLMLGDEVAAPAVESVASPAATPPPSRQAEQTIAAEVLVVLC